jgi:hypothetical protein
MKRSLACLLIPALLLQIASAPIGAANVRSEQGQSTFPTRKQALSRPRVVKMSGTSAAQLRVGSLRNKTTYDLRGFVSTAYREEVTSYPLSFGSQKATSGLVVIGGQVLGGNPWEWTPMDSDRLRIWMPGIYEDVTVVLGPGFVGRYPRPVPHGVTITRDWSGCDAAIARWHKRHPS